MNYQSIELEPIPGVPLRTHRDAWRVTLETDIPVQGKALEYSKIRFEHLLRLENLRVISMSGPIGNLDDLIGFLASHPNVEQLFWTRSNIESFDAADTHLSILTLGSNRLKRVSIPPTLERLSIACRAPVSNCIEVTTPPSHSLRQLSVGSDLDRVDFLHKIIGIESVHELFISNDKCFDIAHVSCFFPRIQKLSLHGRKDFVSELRGLDSLKEFADLRELELFNIYDFCVRNLLDACASASIRKLTVMCAFRDVSNEINRLKSEYRFEIENVWPKDRKAFYRSLTNPFGMWESQIDKKFAQRACEAYVKCKARIDSSKAKGELAGLDVLREFIDTFNDMIANIDSIRREEVCDVFSELANQAGYSTEEASKLLDQWRDF